MPPCRCRRTPQLLTTAVSASPAASPCLQTAAASIKTPVMTLPLHPGLGAEAAAELAVRLKRIRLAEALKGGCCVHVQQPGKTAWVAGPLCGLCRGAASTRQPGRLRTNHVTLSRRTRAHHRTLRCSARIRRLYNKRLLTAQSSLMPLAAMSVEENVIARTSAMAFGRGRVYTVHMQVRSRWALRQPRRPGPCRCRRARGRCHWCAAAACRLVL